MAGMQMYLQKPNKRTVPRVGGVLYSGDLESLYDQFGLLTCQATDQDDVRGLLTGPHCRTGSQNGK